jgi:hypothetical protein
MRTLSLLALAVCSGCITTTTLRPGQLSKLDGYDAAAVTQPTRTLETTDGEQVEFSSNKVLKFESKGDAPVKGLLQHFEVDARRGQLRGRLVSGQTFTLDPSSLTATKMSWVSPGQTAGLIGLFIAGTLAGGLVSFVTGFVVYLLGGGRMFGSNQPWS